jgi:hypothetical protein
MAPFVVSGIKRGGIGRGGMTGRDRQQQQQQQQQQQKQQQQQRRRRL